MKHRLRNALIVFCALGLTAFFDSVQALKAHNNDSEKKEVLDKWKNRIGSFAVAATQPAAIAGVTGGASLGFLITAGLVSSIWSIPPLTALKIVFGFSLTDQEVLSIADIDQELAPIKSLSKVVRMIMYLQLATGALRLGNHLVGDHVRELISDTMVVAEST